MSNVIAVSPDGTLASRAGSRQDRETAERRDAAFLALADKANKLAHRYCCGDRVPPGEDLPSTSQGDLDAAGSGSLGLSPHVRDACRGAIHRYYEAVRERSRADG